MGNVSKNFNRKEFACKCGCGFAAVDVQLVGILETVRGYFNNQVIINSACRCQAHNKAQGGAAKSQHVYGMAADIVVKGVDAHKVADYLERMYPDSGIGRYSTFTHIDVRGHKARFGER